MLILSLVVAGIILYVLYCLRHVIADLALLAVILPFSLPGMWLRKREAKALAHQQYMATRDTSRDWKGDNTFAAIVVGGLALLSFLCYLFNA